MTSPRGAGPMLFQTKLPAATLGPWCRAMRHGLGAGLSPVRVLRLQAKGGPPAGRPLAAALADRLETGESLADALADHRDRFPMLFTEVVTLGEQTGRLSEAFEELERHFDELQSARKQFAAAMVLPALTLVGSVLTVAVMLLVLGLIAPAGGKAFDPLGLGLTGPAGAAVFVGCAVLAAAFVGVGLLIIRENDALRQKAEALALRVPAVGGCFRAFAVSRFSTALHMTGEAGLRVDKGLRLAFRATANDAYLQQADAAAGVAKKGGGVHEALEPGRGRLFPDEFLDSVHVGEVSGQLPEVMAKQAAFYRTEAARMLQVLTRIAGMAVYGLVGLMVVVVIVKLATTVILGPLNEGLNAADNPEKWLRGGN